MEDKKIKKIISKKDIILIIVILVVAAGIWGALTLFDSPQPTQTPSPNYPHPEEDIVYENEDIVYEEENVVYGEIFFGHNSVKLVPLNIDQTFSLPINPNVYFEVRDGEIGFIKSNCLDQVCVNTGFISGEGFFPFAACLPNFLILTINFDSLAQNENE